MKLVAATGGCVYDSGVPLLASPLVNISKLSIITNSINTSNTTSIDLNPPILNLPPAYST